MLQIFPYMAILSIHAINNASCPILVYSSKMAKTLPPLLYSREGEQFLTVALRVVLTLLLILPYLFLSALFSSRDL